MKASYTTYLTLILTLTILTTVNISLAQPMVDVTLNTQKDFYRPGDDFQVSASLFNPGESRIANVYMWVQGPDLVSYYMPDWGDMKRPWFCNLAIDAGTLLPTTVVFETRLPDYSFPVWIPGNYQIFMQLVEAGTDVPLAPAAMAAFTVKRGLADVVSAGDINCILDIELFGGDLWAGGMNGLLRWSDRGGLWEHRFYDRFDGISDGEVLGMFRDQFGNLLMWPYYGLGMTSFDGYSFQAYMESLNLEILGMVTDCDQTLWAAGYKGILSLNRNGEIKWHGAEDGLPEGYEAQSIDLNVDGRPVVFIYAAPEGGGSNEYHLASHDGQSWSLISVPRSVGAYTTRIMVDMQDHVWFATVQGATEFDGTEFTTYDTDNSPIASNYVYRIKLGPADKIWFCCLPRMGKDGGLCYYDGANWGGVPGFETGDVTDFDLDLDGTLYVGRRCGVSVQSPGDLPTLLRVPAPAFGTPQRDVAWGSDGVLYMPDSQKGLWSYANGEWALVNGEGETPLPPTFSIVFTDEGVGWIGCEPGVIRWEGDAFTTFTGADGIGPGRGERVEIDARGWVWSLTNDRFGGGTSLSSYDGNTWHNHSEDDGAPSNPTDFDVDTGGRVWVRNGSGVAPYSLLSFDGQSWTTWPNEDQLAGFGHGTGLVFCDQSGNIIVSCLDSASGEYSLTVCDGDFWASYPINQPFDHAEEDQAGRIWLGRENGGAAIWSFGSDYVTLRQEFGDLSSNSYSLCGCSPDGDMFAIAAKSMAKSLECQRLNPNVAAVANNAAFMPGDMLSVKCWAENPGGAEREVDFWLSITMPTGEVAYWPALDTTPAPALTVNLPAETTLRPVELFSFVLPDTVPAGEYIITPWFCDRGSIDQTGQNTPARISIVSISG
ncbi:hypothetical protein J7M28_01370 [bacterium]|nr:hypothetical protein [bacterium]